jgi:DNA-binding response OmpR family regulator
VEDDPDTAAMLSLLLKNDGHQVLVARTLHDAIARSDRRWDVVISDIGLPDGSGLELASQMVDAAERPRLIAPERLPERQRHSQERSSGIRRSPRSISTASEQLSKYIFDVWSVR